MLKTFPIVIFYLLLFVILTLFTQVGGIIWLLSLLLCYKFINRRYSDWWKRLPLKISAFLVLYLFCILLVVPYLAGSLGRVQLPLFRTNNLQPGNSLTFFLGRNYVRPELRQAIFNVAEKANKEFPGTIINYLDTSFPF